MSKAQSDTSSKAAGKGPEWIDVPFIQDALQGSDDSKVQVKTISISRATAPGDNYCSDLYRVEATLDNGEIRSILAKCSPEAKGFGEAVAKSGVFRTETAMLADSVPAMQALLKRVSPSLYPPFAARCFKHGSSPAPFLVLEDLKPQGFRLAERRRGLGLRHSLMAIRTLARYHAASAALLVEDPRITNNYPNPIKEEDTTWDTFLNLAFDMSANVCKKMPGYEEYATLLEKLKPKAKGFLARLNNPLPGRFKVIVHGDFWTNNMMFQYDEQGNIKDFRMVDFQISHVASPVVDILYFLSTSLSEEVAMNHEAMLLREYHYSLTETLNHLGVQGPSFEELMEDIATCGMLGVHSAISVWPIARVPKVADLDGQAAGNSSGSSVMYDNENTKRWYQQAFPKFKRRGWFKDELNL